MKSDLPQVDVIIAVRNGRPFIKQAVSSALSQTNVSISVTVVDDSSDDGTIDEILSMGSKSVQIISGHAKESAAAGRNRGVLHSNSEWISFLDADDLWPPSRTEDLIRAIQTEIFAISYGKSVEFSGDNFFLEIDDSLQGNSMRAVCIGGTVFSRRTFEKVGPLNTELQVGEFVEWFARARDLGIVEVEVPSISLFRRNHLGNTSRERRDSYREDMFSIIRSHRERLSADEKREGLL